MRLALQRSPYGKDGKDPIHHHSSWTYAFYVTSSGIVLLAAYGAFTMKQHPFVSPSGTDETKEMMTLVIATSLMAVFSTMVIFFLLKRYAGQAIKSCCISMLVFSGMAALSAFSVSIMSGAFSVLATIGFAFYLFWYWKRIEFAGECLRISMKVLENNISLLCVAFGFCALLLLWALVCGFASHALGEFFETEYKETAQTLIVIPLFLWGNIVLSWVLYCVGSGVMGRYLLTNDDDLIGSSLSYAITAGMGPICLLAFVLAGIRFMRILAERARNHNRDNRNNNGGAVDCFFCMILCLINMVETWMKYLSEYGLIFCTMYNVDIFEGGRDVMDLFERSGFLTIVNDDFTSMPFTMATVLLGLLNGMGAGLLGSHLGLDPTLSGIIGALLGVGVASLVFSTLPVMVRTLFVVWVSNKSDLQKQHPEIVADFQEALHGCEYRAYSGLA